MSTTIVEALAAVEKAEILAVVNTLTRANYEKNAALFAAQFAPHAAIYNLAPPLVHHGMDVAEKQAWMDSWSTPITLEARDFEVHLNGDMAFCHGFLRMQGTKRGAEGAVEFWMRETLCLERSSARGASGWHIVHEHTSVPFYMDATLRPAFDLKPE